jgi:hypothetical protein
MVCIESSVLCHTCRLVSSCFCPAAETESAILICCMLGSLERCLLMGM